jgi:hypothetical protein
MNKQIGIEGNKILYGVFYGVQSDGTGESLGTEEELLSNPDFIIKCRFGYAQSGNSKYLQEYHFNTYKNGKWSGDMENLCNINNWGFGLTLVELQKISWDASKCFYNAWITDTKNERRGYTFKEEDSKVFPVTSIYETFIRSFFPTLCSEIIPLLQKCNSWEDIEREAKLYESSNGYPIPLLNHNCPPVP